MMRSLHPGRRSTPHSVWMWMVTLCASLLFCVSTAQACHAHDSVQRPGDGRLHLVAPLDECPLCAAPHAALATEATTTVARAPETERLALSPPPRSFRALWPFDLFSRPPPSSLRQAPSATAGLPIRP